MQEVELLLGANIDAWSCEVIFFAGRYLSNWSGDFVLKFVSSEAWHQVSLQQASVWSPQTLHQGCDTKSAHTRGPVRLGWDAACVPAAKEEGRTGRLSPMTSQRENPPQSGTGTVGPNLAVIDMCPVPRTWRLSATTSSRSGAPRICRYVLEQFVGSPFSSPLSSVHVCWYDCVHQVMLPAKLKRYLHCTFTFSTGTS
jgi:hypothetical protein